MAAPRTRELREIAEQVAAALPAVAEEVVLTGSVSRGTADELSDIEMLIVTAEPLTLETCFAHIRAAGLTDLDTWGPQGTQTNRVFGYFEGRPVETIWWPRDFAEEAFPRAAEAMANGVSLRTVGLLARWQERLRDYPDELAAEQIEDAALTWGGFHPAGFLTLARAGDRLALVERLVDDATRVLRIVYALNRTWLPTSKRLAARTEQLAVKPERLAERIEEALSELDPTRAMRVMTRLQIDAVDLAPSGPNVDRARVWLRAVDGVLG